MKGLTYRSASRSGFLVAFIAAGSAWILLAMLAASGDASSTPHGLAWAHLLGFGCFGTFAIALAMRSLEGRSRFPAIALASALALFLSGWVGLVLSFWFEAARWTLLSNLALALGSLGILVPLAIDVLRRAGRTQERIVRRLAGALILLLAASLSLGMLGSFALEGIEPIIILQTLPALHLHVAFLLWTVVVVLAGLLNGFDALKPSSRGIPGTLRTCAACWFVIAVALGIASLAGARLELAYGLVLLLGCMGNIAHAAAAQVLASDADSRDRALTAALWSYQFATVLIVLGTIFLTESILLVAAPLGFFSWLVYGFRFAALDSKKSTPAMRPVCKR